MTSYIRDTSFAATLGAAMNEFHRALTYRWRLDLCEAIERNRPFMPNPTASGPLGRRGFNPTLAAAGTGANVPRVESFTDLYRTWEALRQRRAQAEEYVVGDE